jgi:hypothetical protein
MIAFQRLTAGMRGWTTIRRLGGVLLGCAVLAGCESSSPAPLQPRAGVYLQGVPVPEGFKIRSKKTMMHESSGGRMARQEYKGSSGPQTVRVFYREQMTAAGWSCVSDDEFKGQVELRFERQGEACTIEIEQTGLFKTDTRVKVELVPFNRGTPLKPLQPPS